MENGDKQEKEKVDVNVGFPPVYMVKVQKNEIDFPLEYKVKITNMVPKSKTGFRNLCLFLIATALIMLAIPAIYNFRLTLTSNQNTTVVRSMSDDNIAQAKNTVYENGIIGIMLDNFDRNLKWSFFTSNTGHYVVDAKGEISNPAEFLKRTNNSTRISSYSKISDLNSITASDVSKMSFRIQFVKNIGSVYETEYNHYTLNTADLTITMKNGTTKKLKPSASSLLDYIEAYLQEPLN